MRDEKMDSPGIKHGWKTVENQTLSRLLLVVLTVLGISFALSALIFPEIAWVLIILFLYILALEAILLTSN
jgi:hypothetical protein